MANYDYTEKMKKLGPVPEDMRIFWVRDDLARIEAKMPYCLQCISEGREIVASLDDVAQIIGTRVPIVADDDLVISKALSRTSAVLVDAEQQIGANVLPVSGSATDGKVRRNQDYVITTGRDPYEAFVALTVLEKAAEVQIKGDALGGVKPIPDKIARRLRRDYLNNYSKAGRERREKEFEDGGVEENEEELNLSENSPQNTFSENESSYSIGAEGISAESADVLIEELHQRGEMVKTGKLLVEKNLVQGTWGNISVRIDDEYMLVTPSGLDYDSLKPEDMVKVNIETGEYEKVGNKPTSELKLHLEIYKARPDLACIIHTHSRYCSIFAACQMPIDVKDIYLAEEIKDDVIYISDYAGSGTDELALNVVKALGEEKDFGQGRRAAIMSNHGMVAAAALLEDAVEVALAAEEAARQLINERLLKSMEKAKTVEEENDGEHPVLIGSQNQSESENINQNQIMLINEEG